MSPKRIKPANRLTKGKHILAREVVSERNYDHESPVFCLKHTDIQYCITNCSPEQQHSFVKCMKGLSQVSWQQILLMHRESKYGSEKIAQSAIKRPIPSHITADETLLGIRFWEKARMVGYREREIFRIIWFDHDYSLYDHG